MDGTAPAAIRGRMQKSSFDADRHESSITTYAKVITDLLRHYASNIVIAKTDENISSLQQDW